MKYRSSRAPKIALPQTPSQAGAPSRSGESRSTGPGLIFECEYPQSGNGLHCFEANEIGKSAQLWGWCEWVRTCLVVAGLMAAGAAAATKTLVQRAQARSIYLQYRSSLSRTRADRPAMAESGGVAPIGAIHYWSDDHSTTVTVDLKNMVYFEAHRLQNPERIYFDLRTPVPEHLNGKVIQVGVGDMFLQKIRVAERKPGVTRIVLETKQSCAYSAMIAPDPYRLVVKLHAAE